ncbi:hypothetical protein D3C80_1717620 [compost metagenome]
MPDRAKAGHQHQQNAQQQRRLDRPDGGELGDIGLYRRAHARQAEAVGLAVPGGNPVGEQQVHHAHQQQWRECQQRVRQFQVGGGFRFVAQV